MVALLTCFHLHHPESGGVEEEDLPQGMPAPFKAVYFTAVRPPVNVATSLPIKCEIRGSKSLGSYSTVEATHSRGRCLILLKGPQKSPGVSLHMQILL